MHYKIKNGVVVKTENAAKPNTQASNSLIRYIMGLGQISSAFDYGCGKLRYMNTILQTTDKLTNVDSEIQISRVQKIHGTFTTITEFIKNSNRISALNVKDFSKETQKYDRAFCINVLSVIPFMSARRNVLSLIKQNLNPDGTCLFVVQYRNSDFSRMKELPNSCPWKDGFIMNSLRGFSFYALISPDRLTSLLREEGFKILDMELNNGRIFVLAKPVVFSRNKIIVVRESEFLVDVT